MLKQESKEGDPFIDEETGETIIEKRERERGVRMRDYDTSGLDRGIDLSEEWRACCTLRVNSVSQCMRGRSNSPVRRSTRRLPQVRRSGSDRQGCRLRPRLPTHNPPCLSRPPLWAPSRPCSTSPHHPGHATEQNGENRR